MSKRRDYPNRGVPRVPARTQISVCPSKLRPLRGMVMVKRDAKVVERNGISLVAADHRQSFEGEVYKLGEPAHPEDGREIPWTLKAGDRVHFEPDDYDIDAEFKIDGIQYVMMPESRIYYYRRKNHGRS